MKLLAMYLPFISICPILSVMLVLIPEHCQFLSDFLCIKYELNWALLKFASVI